MDKSKLKEINQNTLHVERESVSKQKKTKSCHATCGGVFVNKQYKHNNISTSFCDKLKNKR